MKRYNEIEKGMRFISGVVNPQSTIMDIEHNHLMEVIGKSRGSDEIYIRHLKCLKHDSCPMVQEQKVIVSSERLANIEKEVYFRWLDTEVARLLYEE